jgi:hypothetical protein
LVRSASFSANPDAAADTNAPYAVTFTAVGKLTTGYSQIRLVAPPGTVLPGAGCNYHARDKHHRDREAGLPAVTLSNSGATATITDRKRRRSRRLVDDRR